MVCLRVVHTGDNEQVRVLLSMSLMDDMLKEHSFLVFVSNDSEDLMEPE